MLSWTVSSALIAANSSMRVLTPRSVLDSSSPRSRRSLSWSFFSRNRASNGVPPLRRADGQRTRPLPRSDSREGPGRLQVRVSPGAPSFARVEDARWEALPCQDAREPITTGDRWEKADPVAAEVVEQRRVTRVGADHANATVHVAHEAVPLEVVRLARRASW